MQAGRRGHRAATTAAAARARGSASIARSPHDRHPQPAHVDVQSSTAARDSARIASRQLAKSAGSIRDRDLGARRRRQWGGVRPRRQRRAECRRACAATRLPRLQFPLTSPTSLLGDLHFPTSPGTLGRENVLYEYVRSHVPIIKI